MKSKRVLMLRRTTEELFFWLGESSRAALSCSSDGDVSSVTVDGSVSVDDGMFGDTVVVEGVVVVVTVSCCMANFA